MNRVSIRHLGLRDYGEVFAAMQAFNQGRTPQTEDEIWLVQHPPVFTLGLNGKREHLLMETDIPLVETDRGGQITYHGPGQLVMYLLFDVKRHNLGVRELVTRLEQSVVAYLDARGVDSYARKEAPGVYVAGKKIASIGLRVKRGGCYHGLSLNVDMDLAPFRLINPCGYKGLEVTSMRQLGLKSDISQVTRDYLDVVINQFEIQQTVEFHE